MKCGCCCSSWKKLWKLNPPASSFSLLNDMATGVQLGVRERLESEARALNERVGARPAAEEMCVGGGWSIRAFFELAECKLRGRKRAEEQEQEGREAPFARASCRWKGALVMGTAQWY